MATKNLETKLASINARIAALQANAEAIRKQEVGDVVAKIKDAIAHYGLTAADLGLATRGRKAAAVSTTAKSVRKSALRSGRKVVDATTAAKSARAAKYSDGQGRTWSGIGKRPGWFKAELAAGKSPEDWLVKA